MAPKLEDLLRWYDDWEEQTRESRELSERDRDFYDGKQWTDDEVKILQRRGQPVITINRIASKVNFILGTEIKTRVDPKAFPRTPEHEDGAAAITDALRYVSDETKLDEVGGRVAMNMMIEGYGGAVVQVKKRGEMIDLDLVHVPWDRLWYDPHSKRHDFSDAKYRGAVLWMDRDDVVAKYPDLEEDIDTLLAADKSSGLVETHDDKPRGWIDTKRKRLKVLECYYQEGEEYYRCDFTDGLILLGPKLTGFETPDGENECPLIMQSAFIDRDNNRRGVIRNMISPQEEINKRRSKALHLLSVRQTMAERGAVDVPTVKRELAKPDGHIEHEPGLEFNILPTSDFAQGQFQLLAEAKAEIDSVGPNAALLGTGQAQSGREVIARQQGGSMELEGFFAELRSWRLSAYKQYWHRIRQFWTTQMWVRVRDDSERTGFRFLALNRSTTKGERMRELMEAGAPPQSAAKSVGVPPEVIAQGMQQIQAAQQQGQDPSAVMQQMVAQLMASPAMQEPFTQNDVAALDVDIILEEAPDTVTIQAEQFEQLAQMAQAGIPIEPEVLIEASQLRNKRQLLRKMEDGKGQAGQAQQAAMQVQQAMMQQQQQMAQAKLQMDQMKLQIEEQKLQLEAIKIKAQAMRDQSSAKNQEALAMKHATEAGISLADAESGVM